MSRMDLLAALYVAAVTADNWFTAELERVYGKKEASERRYKMGAYPDVALQLARETKHKADAAWLQAQRTPEPTEAYCSMRATTEGRAQL